MATTLPTTTDQLDPSVLRMVRAIRTVESGGQANYNAVGDNATSTGAFQFQAPTWQGYAKQVLGDANAPMTPENQNKVAYGKIADWKAQGFTPQQVAAAWNAGEQKAKDGSWQTNIGTTTRNGQTLSFDTPAYVNKVITAAQQFKSLEAPATPGTVEAAGTPDQTTTQPQPEQTPGAIGSIARFLGIDSLGVGIGRALYRLTPQYKELQTLKDSGAITPEEFNQISTGNVTGRQMLAGAGNLALDIGTAGAGSGLAEGATLGQKLIQGAKIGAGIGAASGGINAFGNNQNVLAGTAKGAALGGTLGLGGSLATEALSGVFNKIPEAVMNETFSPTLNETKKTLAYGTDSFGKQVLDHGVVGTNKAVYQQAITQVDKNESTLQNILKGVEANKNVDSTLTKEEIKPYFDSLFEHYSKIPGSSAEKKILNGVLEDLPDKISITKANEIKRAIYQELGDPAYKFDPNLSTKREALKTTAHGLKELIEKKASNTLSGSIISDVNKELAFWGKLRDRALTKMAKSANKVGHVGLGDFATIGAGALHGGVPGALLAEVGKKAVGTTLAKTAGAQAVSKLGRLATPGVQEIVNAGGRLTNAAANRTTTP